MRECCQHQPIGLSQQLVKLSLVNSRRCLHSAHCASPFYGGTNGSPHVLSSSRTDPVKRVLSRHRAHRLLRAATYG